MFSRPLLVACEVSRGVKQSEMGRLQRLTGGTTIGKVLGLCFDMLNNFL